MTYFLETVETIIPGVGFAQFDTLHFLNVYVVVVGVNLFCFKQSTNPFIV